MGLFKKIKVTSQGVYLLDEEYKKKFNKLTLSPSTVGSWISSPADFVLDKFVLDEVSEKEAPHFTRGKWFHSTMEEFFKINPEERDFKTLFEVSKKVTNSDDYREFSQDPDNQLWYKEIMTLYTQDYISTVKEEKIAKLNLYGKLEEGLELQIKGKLADTKRNCFGYIDKVIEGKNGLIIQDWKTGKTVSDFNPNKKISDSNPFDYWRQQTMYAMLLEKHGAIIEGASLIFPLARTVVHVDCNNQEVREQVLKDLIQVDSEMTKAVEDGYFFPFKRGKYNKWSSWLGGLGSAKAPDIIEGKFMSIADLSEIGF